MFSSFLCPPLVALVAYVVVVSSVPSIAPPSLTVKASASDLNIDGLGNLKVTTTVVNTGGESLKLLNDPRGVLDSFPENSFTFARSPSGSRPSFVGARASYNSTLAAGLDDPSAFTVLAPGGSVNVTHNLSAAYDFTRSGTGEYSIEPSNLFTYIDADGIPKALYATVGDIVKVKLSGDLGVSGRVHSKRAPTFPGCQERRVDDLLQAIDDVTEWTLEAGKYLDQVTSRQTATERYRTWFGMFNPSFRFDIKVALFWISDPRLFSGVQFTCLNGHVEGAPSPIFFHSRHDQVYVLPDAFTDQLIVYMVHQAVHQAIHQAARAVQRAAQRHEQAPNHAARLFNFNIRDWGLGIQQCIEYARRRPDIAARNAENYAHFIINRDDLD